jgi:hypothetical protein
MVGTGPSSGPPEFRLVLGALGWGEGEGLGLGEGEGLREGLGPRGGLDFGFVGAFCATAASALNIPGPYNPQLKPRASAASISAATNTKTLLSRSRIIVPPS